MYQPVTLLVVMDHGGTLSEPQEVVTDQRDISAWEMRGGELPQTEFTKVRYVAYAAMTRQKRYAGTFDQFASQDCADVEYRPAAGDDEGAEDEQRLDPGRPAAGGRSSSRSRTAPANRSPRVASKRGTRAT